jgi:hypothetical protein
MENQFPLRLRHSLKGERGNTIGTGHCQKKDRPHASPKQPENPIRDHSFSQFNVELLRILKTRDHRILALGPGLMMLLFIKLSAKD